MKTNCRLVISVMILFALVLTQFSITTSAYAAGITVNSLADSILDDGVCTLREAINNANSDLVDTSSGDCAVGTGTDSVTFSVAGTIHYQSLPILTNWLSMAVGR